MTALHWGVAQGAQLQNIQIRMAASSNGNGHTGIHLTEGSTLGLSDVQISGGLVCSRIAHAVERRRNPRL